MVLLVLVALGLLSALALSDATLATRAATLAEDEVLARAALLEGLPALAEVPDVAWLCLQPPASPLRLRKLVGGGRSVEVAWWMVAPGVVRAELVGIAAAGGRHRRLAWLRPDSLDPADPRPGCPEALRLEPLGAEWLGAHPEG
jgi:hypothetical protein